jgi:hypothetical protein
MDLTTRKEKPKTKGKANEPSVTSTETAAVILPVVPQQVNTPSEPRFSNGNKDYNPFSIVLF